MSPQNHKAPLCFLHIASITQYYCKICHYTTQIGRSVISSRCQPRFKGGHSGTSVCDTLSRTMFRLRGLKVLLNALGSCSALNCPSQSEENLSICTPDFGMRNRILDSGAEPQKLVLKNSLFRLICFNADHVRCSAHGMLRTNMKGNLHISPFLCVCMGSVGLQPQSWTSRHVFLMTGAPAAQSLWPDEYGKQVPVSIASS